MNINTYSPTEVDQVLVPHGAFEKAKGRISRQLIAAQNYKEPTCIALLGESRTGKTRLLRQIAQQFPEQRLDDGLLIPVLFIKTPSKPSVKGLVETFLSALGDPLCFRRGSENEKTERLFTLLAQTRTHTVIIDEFQHFYDKVSNRSQHYLADWLKIFVDRSGLTIIVAGLPTSLAVVNQNEQLRGRFLAPIHLKRFDWLDAHDIGEFVACLDAFQAALTKFDFPRLDVPEMAFRFYCATGGLIGYIAKLLHQACVIAMSNNKRTITLEYLAAAYEEAIWSDDFHSMMNPFDASFGTTPTVAFVKAAKQLGVASIEMKDEVSPSNLKQPKFQQMDMVI
jgi:predicted AAA+ superfamily ATPase